MKGVSDFRVSTGLLRHPKMAKLIRRAGDHGCVCLFRLFAFAAENRPDGQLAGLSDEDVELGAGWTGEPGALVSALVEVGFLDAIEGGFAIHDWAEHQPWAVGAQARSQKARKAAYARHHGGSGKDAGGMLEPASSTAKSCSEHASSMQQAASSNAPSPSPSPSPSPNPSLDTADAVSGAEDGADVGPDPCPHQAIIALYHEILPELCAVRTWNEQRQAFLRKRWREDPQRQNLDWWRDFFQYIRNCPLLMGQKGGGWEADLEWLIRPTNFVKVIEGRYEEKAAVYVAAEPFRSTTSLVPRSGHR